MRTIPDISAILSPLENAIRFKLLPALLEGRICTDDERSLLSLPVRLGGKGLINVVAIADAKHENSKQATKVLTDAILAQQIDLPPSLDDDSSAAKAEIRSRRRKQQADQLEAIHARMTPEQLRANTIAQEVGASSWLSTLPLTEKGFCAYEA